MHKTKEVRSACGTNIHTPAEFTQQEEKPLKKNDLLLQVVKSNNFQKLLSSRSNMFVILVILRQNICQTPVSSGFEDVYELRFIQFY